MFPSRVIQQQMPDSGADISDPASKGQHTIRDVGCQNKSGEM